MKFLVLVRDNNICYYKLGFDTEEEARYYIRNLVNQENMFDKTPLILGYFLEATNSLKNLFDDELPDLKDEKDENSFD